MHPKSFSTTNNFEYQFMPNEKIITINSTCLKNKTYYKGRESFFKNNGLFDSFHPKLDIEYEPSLIKSDLANLRMLLIEVTDGCNLACEYCGYGKLYSNYDKRSNKKIDFDNIKILIDYLYDLWVSPLNVSFNNTITIAFYGGEPLLSFDIIKKTIEYIENLKLENVNFQYNMTSNGVLLDKYMDFLMEKDFYLLLSLDGNKTNNSYRINKNGKESFDIVIKNIKKIKDKYPEYFEEKVNFNSVLHNRNNEDAIISFLRNEFGKVPRISALNTNGIDKSKIDDFNKLFKNRDFVNINKGDNTIDSALLGISTDYFQLNSFYDAFLSNSFNSYADLFSNESDKSYIPTGTCSPFNRKLFLTVNGKILPCERVGQTEPLGVIRDGVVIIDFDNISKSYSKKYSQVINQCRNCINWKNCSYCVFYIKERNGKLVCDRLNSDNLTSSYLSNIFSLLEEKPLLFKELIKRTFKY